jgi:hypothetical protein
MRPDELLQQDLAERISGRSSPSSGWASSITVVDDLHVLSATADPAEAGLLSDLGRNTSRSRTRSHTMIVMAGLEPAI